MLVEFGGTQLRLLFEDGVEVRTATLPALLPHHADGTPSFFMRGGRVREKRKDTKEEKDEHQPSHRVLQPNKWLKDRFSISRTMRCFTLDSDEPLLERDGEARQTSSM